MTLLTVLVHYNNPKECISVIQELSAIQNCIHHIMVVDNQSTPENYQKLYNGLAHTQCDIIQNSINGGYGSGINLGVQVGQKYKPDYIQVLNTDVSLCNTSYPSCIMELMEENPNIGIIGPAVKYKNGTIQNTILPRVSLKSALFFQKSLTQTSSIDTQPQLNEVDVNNGVCMFIRNTAFLEINGFDEDFFMYGEEQDFCHRMKQKGYSSQFWSGESIIHFEEHNQKKYRLVSWRDILVRANQLLYIKKHINIATYLFVATIYCIKLIIKKIRTYTFHPISLTSACLAFFSPEKFNRSFKKER
jgi:GT2 family glycosyltransferase